ncbi:MAG: tRNA lysidine(34) synthetase TilS [Mollicutes bacterium PWAP]|nr:tRNA lysidine(34) synthetase TilS [Mollicutes bacterium PWAP]
MNFLKSKNPILVAVSGGPDSMFLINKYKVQNIIAIHVNYNKRETSKRDEEIVKNYCLKNSIPLRIKNIKESEHPDKGNFQDFARNIRYSFFKEIAIEFNAIEVVTGHHLDDFLETALMQKNSKRQPNFYGIRLKNVIDGLKIRRPLIDLYFKDEILLYLNKKNIPFGIDETNNNHIYERNKIRKELSHLTKKEKLLKIKNFYKLNKKLLKKNTIVKKEFKKWSDSEFDSKTFKNLNFKEEVCFIYINHMFKNIKISLGKLSSLKNFIEANNGGNFFKLNTKYSLTMKKSKLSISILN